MRHVNVECLELASVSCACRMFGASQCVMCMWCLELASVSCACGVFGVSQCVICRESLELVCHLLQVIRGGGGAVAFSMFFVVVVMGTGYSCNPNRQNVCESLNGRYRRGERVGEILKRQQVCLCRVVVECCVCVCMCVLVCVCVCVCVCTFVGGVHMCVCVVFA